MKQAWNNPFSPNVSQHLDLPARLRIKSRKDIELLFENDQSFFSHPLLLKFHISKLPEDQISSPQFAVSVPKRNFKKAHDRNLLKRRIREAYRLNWKSCFPETSNYQVLLMFIFVGKKLEDYQVIENGILQVFKKLVNMSSSKLMWLLQSIVILQTEFAWLSEVGGIAN